MKTINSIISRSQSIAVMAIEKVTGSRFVMNSKVALLFEEIHLRRFFENYGVDCVFDVGANEGQYATMLRNRIGYKGLIVSFEPIPSVAESLRRKADRDEKWYVEEVALDKISRKSTFYVMKGKQFSSLNIPSHDEVDLFRKRNAIADQILLETRTLNEFFEKYKSLLGFSRPFLKMDTQGHDLQIAEGAGETLSSFVGIQSELSIRPIYKNAPDFRKIIDFYASQGFVLSAFVPNNEGHFPRLIEIDCIMYNDKFN